jgi:CheY-like chemotaxis protein
MAMKKILVIDYDQNSLATLHAILTKLGYQVITAADGQAGWDKYNKESPDLVLMEAMLPKVHGFELCQRITSERNSQATVFIMTGVYKDRVYRTEALRTYGASEYFEKPLKMSELLASIEAVLGKPEPRAAVEELEERPAAAAPAPSGPVRANHPAPASPDPPKREKPLTDDERFALPDDLDKLSREIPKARKPAPARHEPPAEAKFESLADELIKKVIGESARPEQAVEPKPSGNNGNGNGSAEIDQFLKSALADLDLKKEKVKVPKTAPLPPPPVEAKPIPVPPPPAAFKPKPAPPAPRPETKFSAPVEPPPKITLTPGDPGSDISPFFTPVKLKPDAPAEKPKVQAPAVHPVADVQPPRPSKPVEKAETNPETVKHEPGKPVKINYEPVKHEPVQTEAKDKEAEAIASSGLFGDISSAHANKGPSPLLLVGAAVAVIAVAGFFVLRPKKPAPVEETLQPQQTVTQESVPEQKVEEVPPPEVKPAPVKPKAEPKTKLEELGPAGV